MGKWPKHTNYDWFNRPPAFPAEGKITGIYYPDEEGNKASDQANPTTSGVILYQVQVELRRPYGQRTLDYVPAGNQFTGLQSWDQSDPYPVGMGVCLIFLEGDVERPVIAWPMWDYTSALLHIKDDGPKYKLVRNGAEDTIDKDGNRSIVPKSGSLLTLGDALGSSGLKKLIDERAAAQYNSHTHTVTVSNTGTGVAETVISAGPSNSIGASHMTDTTRAK